MSDPATELERLRAALTAAEGRASAAEAELAQARAVVSTSEAMIAGLKLEIALLRREQYGRSAERTARLIDQLELQLEELVTDAAEDRVRAEKTTKVAAFERRKPVRKSFPEHLPRERVVVPAPTSCTRLAARTASRSWGKTSPRHWMGSARSCLKASTGRFAASRTGANCHGNGR
jgi:transposase